MTASLHVLHVKGFIIVTLRCWIVNDNQDPVLRHCDRKALLDFDSVRDIGL